MFKKGDAEYIETSQAGEPWVLPQGQISVEQDMPLKRIVKWFRGNTGE